MYEKIQYHLKKHFTGVVPSRDSFCVANDVGLSLKLQNVKMGEKRKKKSDLVSH